ncbi:uncharacterized protein BXZ73DRAFT_97728 [Epithele typhae]|uniref:uncharacterized protein n=1 Tax=Epithele typhae TaxID=378194 RepID=UPI0020089528|nr:uncharacterized protein BXZ73DRAFT_97728 [Epithele typhae]KAH9942315.1 hypothetical protein BXZ73DRAFT_97728 [Epithele typhae]
MTATTAWADPHAFHPWFRMPSLKRQLSDDDEQSPSPPSAYTNPSLVDSRRSLSPAPSPKRRRCDVLETGLSKLTLAPAATVSPVVLALWPGTNTNGPVDGMPVSAYAPITTNMNTAFPGSVEEPVEVLNGIVEEVPELPEVSMKGPSWYEVEKDRKSAFLHPARAFFTRDAVVFTVDRAVSALAPFTSPKSLKLEAAVSRHVVRTPALPPPSPFFPPPPSTTVANAFYALGIVITDLEDSDAEDAPDSERENVPPRGAAAADAPAYAISSALLGRLARPPLAPVPVPAGSGALVLYRPLPPLAVVTPGAVEEAEAEDEAGVVTRPRLQTGTGTGTRDGGVGEPMGGGDGDDDAMALEDVGTPMALEDASAAEGDVEYEPMDVEML